MEQQPTNLQNAELRGENAALRHLVFAPDEPVIRYDGHFVCSHAVKTKEEQEFGRPFTSEEGYYFRRAFHLRMVNARETGSVKPNIEYRGSS